MIAKNIRFGLSCQLFKRCWDNYNMTILTTETALYRLADVVHATKYLLITTKYWYSDVNFSCRQIFCLLFSCHQTTVVLKAFSDCEQWIGWQQFVWFQISSICMDTYSTIHSPSSITCFSIEPIRFPQFLYCSSVTRMRDRRECLFLFCLLWTQDRCRQNVFYLSGSCTYSFLMQLETSV